MSSETIDPVKNFFAGGVGGACLVVIGHPPDTIKVRLQTMPPVKNGEKPIYEGTMDCLKKTIRKEVKRDSRRAEVRIFCFLGFHRSVSRCWLDVCRSSTNISCDVLWK